MQPSFQAILLRQVIACKLWLLLGGFLVGFLFHAITLAQLS
jgi:hypothetical protein